MRTAAAAAPGAESDGTPATAFTVAALKTRPEVTSSKAPPPGEELDVFLAVQWRGILLTNFQFFGPRRMAISSVSPGLAVMVGVETGTPLRFVKTRSTVTPAADSSPGKRRDSSQ